MFLHQQRLKTDEYEDIDTFSADINLLFDNAIKFYKSDAQEHRDAIKLKEVFDDAKARLCSQIHKGKLFNWASSQFKIKCNSCSFFIQHIFHNQETLDHAEPSS